jgi:rRNA-processing protein FCF1
MKTKTVFLDTNILIQCKPLDEIPWPTLFEDRSTSILLVVPFAVVAEVDTFKAQGNERRATRAKKANALFKQILESPDGKVFIRSDTPTVECEIGTAPQHAGHPNFLGDSNADRSIVLEALERQRGHDETEVAILTDDTALKVTAKRAGVTYLDVPDDWKLAPEQDAKDKKIFDLEARLKSYEKSCPTFEIGFGRFDQALSSLHVTPRFYRTFENGELDSLVKEAADAYPRITSFEGIDLPLPKPPENADRKKLSVPTQEQVEQYQDRYAQWLLGIREYFARMPNLLSFRERNAVVQVFVKNNGSVPASKVSVRLIARGDLLLASPGVLRNSAKYEGTLAKLLVFPKPPSPPKAIWIDKRLPLGEIVSPMLRPPDLRSFFPPTHDYSFDNFYWNGKEPTEPQAEHEHLCDELSHHEETTIFEAPLFLPMVNTLSRFALECRVTASNTREAISKTMVVSVEPTFLDPLDAAKEHLASSSRPKVTLRLPL